MKVTQLNPTGEQLGMNTMAIHNGTSQFIPNTFDTPNWYPSVQTYVTPYFPFQIRLVANGFVVQHYSQEYIFTNAKEVGEFIAAKLAEMQPK